MYRYVCEDEVEDKISKEQDGGRGEVKGRNYSHHVRISASIKRWILPNETAAYRKYLIMK